MTKTISYVDLDKCKTCKFLTTNNLELVNGKMFDGYCLKNDFGISVIGNSGCSEYELATGVNIGVKRS